MNIIEAIIFMLSIYHRGVKSVTPCIVKCRCMHWSWFQGIVNMQHFDEKGKKKCEENMDIFMFKERFNINASKNRQKCGQNWENCAMSDCFGKNEHFLQYEEK